jgi:hypothetical protein
MPIVRGNVVRPGSPRDNKKLDTKMRHWMVREDALQEHPLWLKSGRVVENDVVVESEKPKKRKAEGLNAENTAGPSSRGKQARRALADKKKALEELGGIYNGNSEMDE